MDWLIPAIISTLLGTIVLVLVYTYLYIEFRQRYLLIWTAGWLVYATRYVFELAFEWSGKQIVFTVFSQIAALLSGLLLLWGAYCFLDRRLPRGWILATVAGALWTLGAAVVGANFLVLTAPNFTLLGLIFIRTGWVFLGSPALQLHGRMIIGWAFILWGIHKFDFPFLRELDWFAPAGFMISTMLEMLVAMVFLLIYFQRVLQERRQAEERYSTILRTSKESEARFRLLVEDFPAAIVISRRGVIDFVNPAYARIFGYEQGEVKGQNLTVHLTPEAQSVILERNQLREEGVPVPMEYETEGLRKDGTVIPLLINAKTIQLAEGRSTLAMISELTVVRQAEAAARLSEARFKAFFEFSPAGMLILDKEFRFAALNEAVAQLVGLAIGEIQGRTVQEIFPDFGGQVKIIIHSIFAGGPPVANLESGGRTPYRSDQHIYFQASFFPLKGENDEIVSVGVVIVDRTVRHEVEINLKKRVAELEVVGRVSTILRSHQNLKDLLPEILTGILTSITAQAGAILLYDQATAQVQPGAAQGWVKNITPPLVAFQKATLQKVLKSRDPLILENLADLPDLTDEVQGLMPQNWAGAIFPLMTLDEPVGVLVVLSPRPFALDDSHQRLLGTLSEMIGAAVHRTRLAERTSRNLQRLAALHEIDRIITSSLDLRLTLEVLLGHVLDHLGVNAVEILKFNQLSQHLEPFVARGFRTSRSEARSLRPGQGPAGRALVERRMIELHLDDGGIEPAGMDPLYRAEGARTIISLPLMSKGQVVGVMVAFCRARTYFDGEALDFFATLASQAALAIEDIGMLEKLRRSNLEMGQSVMATLQGLAKIVELRKQEPEGHTEQLVELTLRLAAVMEVPQSEWLAIRHGVLLHDVGLMWIPDQILLKDGPLSPEEWAVVQRHSQFVYDLFSPIAYLQPALDIPYCHHEKWDGSGYPRGLKSYQIPLSARIFAVVEAWDSMRVSRPFREALPVKEALNQIATLSGTHYDPQVVEKFLVLLAGKI